jgi:hypothetical protein
MALIVTRLCQIQKKTALYGKFEAGNKLDMDQFAECLEGKRAGDASGVVTRDVLFGRHVTFGEGCVCHAHVTRPLVACRITDIVRHSLQSTAHRINRGRRPLCFELYGYDFMVDDDFNVSIGTALLSCVFNSCFRSNHRFGLLK